MKTEIKKEEIFYDETEAPKKEEPKPKKKRRGKTMTPEAREAMLERLKRGRETAMRNRMNKKAEKAKAKITSKKSTKTVVDTPKEKNVNNNGSLMNKLNSLESQIQEMREERRIRRLEKQEAKQLAIAEARAAKAAVKEAAAKEAVVKEEKPKESTQSVVEKPVAPRPPMKTSNFTKPINIPRNISTFSRPRW